MGTVENSEATSVTKEEEKTPEELLDIENFFGMGTEKKTFYESQKNIEHEGRVLNRSKALMKEFADDWEEFSNK